MVLHMDRFGPFKQKYERPSGKSQLTMVQNSLRAKTITQSFGAV